MESIAAALFAANEASRWSSILQIAIICLVLIGPFLLGALLANWLRRYFGRKVKMN